MTKRPEGFLPVDDDDHDDWTWETVTLALPPGTSMLGVATLEHAGDDQVIVRPHKLTGGEEYTRAQWAAAFRRIADIMDPPVEEVATPVATPENTAYAVVEGDPEEWARALL